MSGKRKNLKCSGKFSDLIKFLRETAELEEFNQAINYFRKQNKQRR